MLNFRKYSTFSNFQMFIAKFEVPLIMYGVAHTLCKIDGCMLMYGASVETARLSLRPATTVGTAVANHRWGLNGNST